jgi:hypothetical protein
MPPRRLPLLLHRKNTEGEKREECRRGTPTAHPARCCSHKGQGQPLLRGQIEVGGSWTSFAATMDLLRLAPWTTSGSRRGPPPPPGCTARERADDASPPAESRSPLLRLLPLLREVAGEGGDEVLEVGKRWLQPLLASALGSAVCLRRGGRAPPSSHPASIWPQREVNAHRRP